eukprot:6780196-Alexandrium_andersonii.AAC.1
MEPDDDPRAVPSQPAQPSVPELQSPAQGSTQAVVLPMQQPQRAPWSLAAGAVVRPIGQAIGYVQQSGAEGGLVANPGAPGQKPAVPND